MREIRKLKIQNFGQLPLIGCFANSLQPQTAKNNQMFKKKKEKKNLQKLVNLASNEKHKHVIKIRMLPSTHILWFAYIVAEPLLWRHVSFFALPYSNILHLQQKQENTLTLNTMLIKTEKKT